MEFLRSYEYEDALIGFLDDLIYVSCPSKLTVQVDPEELDLVNYRQWRTVKMEVRQGQWSVGRQAVHGLTF